MTCIAINLLVKVLLLLMNRSQPVVKFHLELFWIICQRVSMLRSLGPPTELLCWWPQNKVPLQLVVAGESLGPWFTRQESLGPWFTRQQKGPRWTRQESLGPWFTRRETGPRWTRQWLGLRFGCREPGDRARDKR